MKKVEPQMVYSENNKEAFMSNRNKILSVILALILALSSITVMPLSVSAAKVSTVDTGDTDPAYPDFEYSVTDGTATITGYHGNETDLEIPSALGGNKVTEIKYNAFEKNNKIEKVIIPGTITDIGVYAFNDCTSLTEISIPESVNSIPGFVFRGCTALTDLYVYGNVDIDNSLLFGNSGPPKKLTIHGYSNSFSECYAQNNNLAFVSIGEVPESDHYSYSINDGKATMCSYSGYQKAIEIPDTYEGYPVTAIGAGAFEYNTSVEEIILPDSVTELQTDKMDKYAGAFKNCYSLKKINIPNGVTAITAGTFYECSSLEEIEIPDSVTSIGTHAFFDCSSLRSVNIPNTVTSIGDDAFKNCSALTTVKLPDSITSISAFDNCSSLTSIEIPDSVTYLGGFGGCSALKSIEIPDSVTVIEGGAFACCDSLTEITIPENVTVIGYRAIANCKNLKTLHLNAADCTIYGSRDRNYLSLDGIETLTIGPEFSKLVYQDAHFPSTAGEFSLPDLKTVSVDEDNPVFDSRDNCNAIIETATNTLFIASENTVIPDTVTSISYRASEATVALAGAFFYFGKLDKVTIPASVESIDNMAFNTYFSALTIYGYEGSAAQTYADRNENITFVPLDTATDESGVTADVMNGVTLDAKNITDTFDGSVLPKGAILIAAYDVNLEKDGKAVQPANVVTVKIPCDDPDAKVYRQETDGSLTDMNAVYRDGYLVFKTTHFSRYLVATGAEVDLAICGDADGDGQISTIDATILQRYLARLSVPYDEETLMNADVDGDGELSVIDVTVILRYCARIRTPYPVGQRI